MSGYARILSNASDLSLGIFRELPMTSYRLPGPLGALIEENIDDGTLCRVASPTPGPLGMTLYSPYQPAATNLFFNNLEIKRASNMNPVDTLSLSDQGFSLLKEIEQLRLKPYDDQTAKEITSWTAGATIGYGHLIKKTEWEAYKNGITVASASTLFEQDLAPFVSAVRSNIKIKLEQQQFDALIMFAFNIGAGANGFAGSSVVKLVNDPKAQTNYKSLEAAWKAWNKSQGKVMKGLENRRACEWNVYSQGIYKKW